VHGGFHWKGYKRRGNCEVVEAGTCNDLHTAELFATVENGLGVTLEISLRYWVASESLRYMATRGCKDGHVGGKRRLKTITKAERSKGGA